MKAMRVLGIMSGTSVDGVDYALCTVSSDSVRLDELWTVPFPAKIRRRIHAAAGNIATSWETAQLHHDLGRFYALGAMAGSLQRRPKLVGLHGQTVFHNPNRLSPAALQLGEPAYLAEAFGVPVVNNFRAADIAAGGQGAPLATIFHQWAFAVPGAHVCVNNLGGISNVTSIDWRKSRGSAPKIMSFDTGPANVLMDLAIRHFSGGRQACDRGGKWASNGIADERLVAKWLKHPYFRQSPPKSTGREMFGESFFESLKRYVSKSGVSKCDVLATLLQFTARSIRLNYRLHLPSAPECVILAGGGMENPVLVEAIRNELAQLDSRTRVTGCDSLGWPAKSIEPAAFALLAWLRMQEKPGNIPSTTGARRAALCGQITRSRI